MKRSEIVCAALFLGLALGGCANTPSKDAKSTSTSTNAKSGGTSASAAAAIVNPYLLKFDAMSAKLTPEHEAQLLLIVPRLKETSSFIVRGYCNRNEVGNAQATALARANSVEKFLIQQGIPDKKMRQRFNTEDALHAVELDVDG